MRFMRTTDLRLEQRQVDRRATLKMPILSTHHAFDADERAIFKALERRRHLRRSNDVKQALVQLER
jgi:hypothetical protein